MDFAKNKLFKKKKSTKRKETVVEFICVILSCWLISVGTCLILDAQFSHQIGLKSILWQTLFAVCAAALLTRRWWIPIIYFGVLVPLFFLAISLSGDIFSFFSSIASFFRWWMSDMPIDSKWYSDQGFYLIHTIMNVGVGILFFAVSRITKRAWVTAGVAFVFIIINYAYGYTGYNVIAIPFLVVGIFPLVAGDKFQKIKLPDVKNFFGVLGKKSLLIFVSTVMATLISLLSFGIIQGVKGSVRTRLCSNIVADIQTWTNAYTKEQQKLKITLFDLGLVMNSTYIGGDLYDIKPRTLAYTDLTQPALVKMTSFDTFNGTTWLNDIEKSYRVDGPWKEEQNLYLSVRFQENENFVNRLSYIGFRTEVNVTLAEKANFLPVFGQVMGFKENNPTRNPILFDKRGRLLSYYGQDKGYSYTLDTIMYDTTQEVMLRHMNGLLGSYTFEEDPQYDKNSEFYKQYTKKFETVPEQLKKDLKELISETDNEFEKVYAISKYFSPKKGYKYTPEPAEFVKGDNIIQKLVDTKKGHCLYYATAMVAMAREVGIPARLAAGYVTVPGADGKQIVDASAPYAWVECYMPNVGWMPFDPNPESVLTPPDNGDDPNGDGNNTNIDVDADITKNTEYTSVTDLKWTTTSELNVPLIVGLGLIALFILMVILNICLSQKFYKLESVKKRFKNPKRQAIFYYKDILRQLSWLGFRFKRGETIGELVGRLCETLDPIKAEAVVEGISKIEELQYGDVIPTEEDIEILYNSRQVLENTLQDRTNVFTYCIKRRLLLPIVSIAVFKYK